MVVEVEDGVLVGLDDVVEGDGAAAGGGEGEGRGSRADVERGGAESQEQAADAERLAELSAKLRLWRLLFFALSEYLGPAEGADAPSVA